MSEKLVVVSRLREQGRSSVYRQSDRAKARRQALSNVRQVSAMGLAGCSLGGWVRELGSCVSSRKLVGAPEPSYLLRRWWLSCGG